MSSFKYNIHGATDIGSIAPLVFESDTNKLTLAINNRKRTNPPPAFINQELSQEQAGEISDEPTARRLRGILTKIEDLAYC